MAKILGDDKTGSHTVYFAGCLQTIIDYLNSKENPRGTEYFSVRGNPFSLYEFLKHHNLSDDKLDMIFVEQSMFYFDKGSEDKLMGWKGERIETPVVYYHRDLWNECFMREPDLLLYRFHNQQTSLKYIDRQIWWATKYKMAFRNAVDPKLFKHDQEKEFKGLNFIGTQRPLEQYLKDDYVQHEYYIDTFNVVEYAKEYDLIAVHDYYKMKFNEYRSILERCESILFIPGKRAYHSRRLYEAAATKSMIVMYVPNDQARKIYNQMGLIHGNNCVMFSDLAKLKNIYILYKNKRKKIVQRAYEWVHNAHTYEVRATQLEKVLVQFLKNWERDHEIIDEIEVTVK